MPSSVLTFSKRTAVRSGCLKSGGVTGIFCSSIISISAIFNGISFAVVIVLND